MKAHIEPTAEEVECLETWLLMTYDDMPWLMGYKGKQGQLVHIGRRSDSYRGCFTLCRGLRFYGSRFSVEGYRKHPDRWRCRRCWDRLWRMYRRGEL
jgi:hypothetical protein